MNDSSMNLPTLPVLADLRQGEDVPGSDLTPVQREAAALSILEGLSHRQLAQRVGVASRTVDRWALTEAWKRYSAYLVGEAVTQARQHVTSHFSRIAPGVAERVGELALGKGRKGKPQHAYMDRFCALVLGGIAPKEREKGLAIELAQNAEGQGIRVIIGHDPRKPQPAWARQVEEHESQNE